MGTHFWPPLRTIWATFISEHLVTLDFATRSEKMVNNVILRLNFGFKPHDTSNVFSEHVTVYTSVY